MAQLVLGPLLRYVGEREAVIWVETDEACEVEVLGHRERTFRVHGHDYCLVVIDGLEPGREYEYEVALDGERRWPEPDSEFPPSVIRTVNGDEPLRLSFGSCRVSLPAHPPYTLPKDVHSDGREFDALRTLAHEMRDGARERWPHALLLLGDQVYADEVSLETRAFIRKRRDISNPPGEEVADFEEYARLYQESWADPAIRWLYSTVSCSMVIDDHDVHDDWNISAAWVDEMAEHEWWAVRETAAIASYWLYQYIGNLSPGRLRESRLLEEVRSAEDGWRVLERFAEKERFRRDGERWSYCRDFGGTRLIVIESRCGRVLEEGRRSILDEEEWDWLRDHLSGDYEHVLIGSSDPLLLALGRREEPRLAGGLLAVSQRAQPPRAVHRPCRQHTRRRAARPRPRAARRRRARAGAMAARRGPLLRQPGGDARARGAAGAGAPGANGRRARGGSAPAPHLVRSTPHRLGLAAGSSARRRSLLDREPAALPGADPAVGDVDQPAEPLALEDRRGQAAALAAAADGGDRPVSRQLLEPRGQLAVRDVDGAGDVSRLVLGGVADVDDQRLGVIGQPLQIGRA